jgi:Asp/Glu/hydantoin racemase
MRIWYQSFTDPVAQAPYMERLRARLAALAAPGTVVEVHGLSPPIRHFHALSEFRCAALAVRNALRAEAEGYDAFILGHFQEPGLTELRGAVDIPVVSLGEACMLQACSMGRKVGLVTIDPVFIPWHEEQIRRHGLEHRVVGVTAIQADLPRFTRAFEDPAVYAGVRAEFVAQVRPLVARGIEVLIPAGGLPMLLLAQEQPLTVDGALVLEGIATVLKAAEMAVALRRATGACVSRSGAYAKAPQGAIEDFLAAG